MDDSKLVPTPSSAARGQTDFTTAERHSLVPASQSNPPSHERSSSSGRVEVISKSLGDRGFSDEAARLITSSWTSGTDKQYNSAWKQWCSWCRQRKIDTLQPPVNEVANFLSKCFEPLTTPLLGPIHLFPDFSRGCTMFALRFRGTPPHGT